MKRIGWLFCAVSAAAMGLAACGGSDSSAPSPGPAPAPAPTPAPPPPSSSTAALAVTVFDTLGQMVAGASVTSGASSAISDAAGRATLVVETGAEKTIRIVKDGFAEQIKVVNIDRSAVAATLQAMLVAREAPQSIADIQAGGSVTGKDGTKVTLPAGALVTAGGQAVTGAVQLSLTPVDVTQLDIGAFPGLFEGIPSNGTRTPIVSFGTAELVPQQAGQSLNLAPGKTAEIELPLYEKRQTDGSDAKPGDTIALWTLDTATGVWTQEGQGVVVLSPTAPTGLALRATIRHFSWWNIDTAGPRATVTLVVNAPGVSVPAGTTASVEGRVIAGTGPATIGSTTVTVGAVQAIQIPANAATRLTATLVFGAQTCGGSTDVSPAPAATVSAVINATCVSVPVPRIVRPADPSATNSSRDVSVQILLDGPRADLVEVLVDGTVFQSFNALAQVQPFYTAFWNSSTAAEGAHRLIARASVRGVGRDSNAVEVVVDRTPPELSSVDPLPGSDVAQSTTYTLQFSEPVTPFPFSLADAVKLAVTPLSGGAPVEIHSTFTMSADGTSITVQAQEPLPPGTVSLTWGGLKDTATNPIAGTVSATFAVDRSIPFLVLPQRPVTFGSPIAIMAGGQPVVTWVEADNNLRVGAFDGTRFVLFGQPSDNPIGSFNGTLFYDLVLDSADLPWVALTENNPNATGNQIRVRRFDGAAWRDVGPVITGLTGGDRSPHLLVLDSAGRPLLAVQRNLFADVLRFDAAANAWQSLGSPDATLGGQAGDNGFDIAFMPNGDPVVAYNEGTPGSNATRLKVARHNGSNWVQLGGIIDSTPNATLGILPPFIRGGANGPWLFYLKSGAVQGNTMRLLHFNGTGWEFSDLPRTDEFPGMPMAMTLLDDAPVLGYGDGTLGIAVTRFGNGRFDTPFGAIGRPAVIGLATRRTAAGVTGFIAGQAGDGSLILERLLFP